MAIRPKLRRLYRGESQVQLIPHRKRWYFASLIIVLVSLISFFTRGFNIGVEFAGGSQFQIQASGTSLTVNKVNNAFTSIGLNSENLPQEVGSGATRQFVVTTKALDQVDATNDPGKLASRRSGSTATRSASRPSAPTGATTSRSRPSKA